MLSPPRRRTDCGTFYNFLRAEHWPTLGDINYREIQGGNTQEFSELWQITSGGAYFFITDLSQLEKQPLLETRLSNYPVIYESDAIRLYSIDP